jgi:Domain of unknown function (DUF222)/HNH endonuclease
MAAAVSAITDERVAIAARRASAADVERRLCELAAHTHAAMAELTRLAAEFNDVDGWCVDGVRSFSEWLTFNTGFAPRTGDELLSVGQALQTLPQIRTAFAAGRLSFDSVRELSRVATPDDEHLWLTVAEAASGAQLARICRACRRVLDLDTPKHADDQLRRRGVWTHFEDDGMLHFRALLPPEEGALVTAAIEAAVRAAETERNAGQKPDQNIGGAAGGTADAQHRAPSAEVANDFAGASAVPDPADEPWAARRADALVAVCQHALTRDGGALSVDPASLPMLVHVDVGALTGQDPDGRRHLDGGPVLSTATIRRLGCDASVIAITERDGIPINVGRSRRILPRSLRRAVQGRDRTCRFPGCAVPAQKTHAHHIDHWADGGPTDLANLVSLCHFHHHRLHDGAYRIRGHPDAGVAFESPDGRPILRRVRGVDPGIPRDQAVRSALADVAELHIHGDTARPKAVTARMNFGYVVSAVVESVQHARQLTVTA